MAPVFEEWPAAISRWDRIEHAVYKHGPLGVVNLGNCVRCGKPPSDPLNRLSTNCEHCGALWYPYRKEPSHSLSGGIP